MTRTFLSIILIHALAVSGATAATLYVDARSSTGDGKSWRTAYRSVEDALKQSKSSDEIWVAAGTYKLTDRAATFQLKTGVALYGGFAGNELNRLRRDWQKNPTILDGNGAYHVVTGADQAILDGFTVTGGNGLGGERGGPPAGGGGRPIHMTPQGILSGANTGSGAGMVNFQVAPTVRNCIFESNKAGKGGAVYNMTSTDFPPRPGGNAKTPVFINCVFRNNSAHGRGGGVSNDLGTAPVFLNCVFEANETPQKGGGMYNDFGCSPTLINCLFTGNKAQTAAGMGNDGGSSPVLYFCTFTKNHAEDAGPSLYQGTGPASNPSVVNCLLTGNTCDWESPGIYNWHDNTPFIKESATGDSGYKPGRFTEAQLPQLLSDLKQYRVQPVREPAQAAPEKFPFAERVVYASAAHAGSGEGRSWATAYASLQAALDDAGKDGAEVRVAAGTYKLAADRSASFVLRPGVRVYGGYSGNQRDAAKHTTVLDGNHAYHVVTGAGGAVLDGFTITGGYADGPGYDGKGGGLIDYRRAPQGRPNSEVVTGFEMTISHCTFTNNYARDGGAVYNYDRAKPVFTACVFAANRSENGGAVLDRVGVESTFKDCEFTGNTAHWRGGAVYFDYGSRPKLTRCVFRNNTTDGHGGAAFSASRASQLENTIVTLTDCRFEGNTAKGYGGAANFHDSSIADVQNCTFTGNKAGLKGNAIAVTSDSSLQSQDNAVAGNDVYEEPSAGPREGGGARPGGAGEQQPGGSGRGAAGGGVGGRPGGRMGGENLPTHFQPSADFSVVIIGSGSPQYDPKRSGPSAAIQYRGRFILVDMGNGTQARLYEAGISMSQIDAFFITHHHRDHDEEFMPLLSTALVRGMPLEIVGTPGTKKLADFTADFYAEDIAYRIERMGRNAQNIRKPNVREIQGGENFKLGDLQVKTAQVPHSIHTVAYRFDFGGQSIVISGDLTYSEKLIELARGADVLVMDSGGSIVRQGARRPAGGEAAAGGGQQPMAHATAQDVCNMAQKAGVKKLVLTHIAAAEVDEEATINAIHEAYKSQVIVGHDLLEVAPDSAASTTPPATRSSSRFIQRLDKDGDGKVSRSEFDGPPDRFGDWDKNNDGFITEEETPQGSPRAQ